MDEFSITKHGIQRMAQRGIPLQDADLIALIGTEVADGYFVRKKDCQAVISSFKNFIKQVQRLEGKRLVVAEGRIVTAYHTSRRQERRLLRCLPKNNLRRAALKQEGAG